MKKLTGALIALFLAPAAFAADAEMASRNPVAAEPEAAAEAPRAEPAPEQLTPEPSATPAAAQTGPVATSSVVNQTPEAEAAQTGFRIGVELDHSLGQGTFANAAYYSSLGGSLGIAPSYSFKVSQVKLAASARASLAWEYTLPDNETGRRVSYSDLRLGLSAPAVYKNSFSGISVSPSIGLLVPLTAETIRASTITSLSVGLGFSRSISKFDLSYKFGFSKGIHGNPGNVISKTDARDEQGNLIFICRTDENYCGTLGTNTNFSFSNSLSAAYHVTEKVGLSISYALVNSFKYAIPDDEFTPQTLDSDGNRLAREVGRGDKTTGSIGVSYALNDNLELSGGMGTAGPARTKDGKNFRFPWFDFISGADSLTQYSVTLSGQF